jgi:hypothetical protein
MKRTCFEKNGIGLMLFPLFVVLLYIISCNSQNKRTSSDTAFNDSALIQSNDGISAQQQIHYCSELVKEILSSSPRYIQLTGGLLPEVKKNGGTSIDIFIDKSPENSDKQASDYSAQYEMQIAESYPDRRVNIAHFTFDPSKNILYEYDVVHNQLITIEYDESLLENSEKFCK